MLSAADVAVDDVCELDSIYKCTFHLIQLWLIDVHVGQHWSSVAHWRSLISVYSLFFHWIFSLSRKRLNISRRISSDPLSTEHRLIPGSLSLLHHTEAVAVLFLFGEEERNVGTLQPPHPPSSSQEHVPVCAYVCVCVYLF